MHLVIGGHTAFPNPVVIVALVGRTLTLTRSSPTRPARNTASTQRMRSGSAYPTGKPWTTPNSRTVRMRSLRHSVSLTRRQSWFRFEARAV